MYRAGPPTNHNLFGITGESFTEKKPVVAKEDFKDTPAKSMQHNFNRELKMARENSMVGNYSISV